MRHLEDAGADRRIILKLTSYKQGLEDVELFPFYSFAHATVVVLLV
jgi:hypothetical protein